MYIYIYRRVHVLLNVHVRHGTMYSQTLYLFMKVSIQFACIYGLRL